MTNEYLSSDEQRTVRAFEAHEFQPVQSMSRVIEQYRTYARSTLQKPRSINIRISDQDLARVKALAAERGVPYQTFISAVIHRQTAKRTPRANLLTANQNL